MLSLYMMRQNRLKIIFASVMLLCAVHAGASSREETHQSGSFLPEWQKGWMDIHTIATGKGDAAFVIMPDGTTMLIDAGDVTGGRMKAPALPNDTRSPGEWIARYIDYFSNGLPHPDKVDYFLLTHFHGDHMGSETALKPGPQYGLCGIMEVGEYLKFGKIIDRGWPTYDYPSAEYVKKFCSSTLDDYRKFVTYQKEHNGTVPECFQVGSRKQFMLLNDPKSYNKDFEVWNVAGNLQAPLPVNGKVVKRYTEYINDIGENALSCAVLIRYGEFSYFNGGDLGGSPADERDMESYVADLIGPVTVIKANHHGWKDTCNPYFMWKTRPDVIIVPSSHVNHPWKATVQRIFDHQMPGKRQMFVTCDAAREQVGEVLWKYIQPYYGHIVVRVYEGGRSYQVFVLDAYSTDYRVLYKGDIEKL